MFVVQTARCHGNPVTLMSATSPCIEPDVMQAFALGLLEEVGSQSIDLHLQTCSICLDRLSHLSTQDTLISALQTNTPISTEMDEPLVEWLIRNIAVDDHVAVENRFQPQLQSFSFAGADLPKQLGKFQLLEVIGHGGMGVMQRTWKVESGGCVERP